MIRLLSMIRFCLLLTGLLCLGGCASSLGQKEHQHVPDIREGLPSSDERFQPTTILRRAYPFGTYQIQQRHGLGGWTPEESKSLKE